MVTNLIEMKSIRSFFKLDFIGKEVSDLNLLCFTDDHLKRLAEENKEGQFSEMLSETSTTYFYFLEAHKEKEKVKGSKEIYTKEVRILQERLKDAIRMLEAFVRFKYSKASEEYKQIFPKGLSEYCQLNRSNVELLLTKIFVFLNKQKEAVDENIRQEIEDTYTAYQHNRKKQLHKKSDYINNVKSKKQLREDLSVRLQLNLYTLAIHYLGQPEKAELFFNEKLLRSKRLKKGNAYRSNQLKSTELSK